MSFEDSYVGQLRRLVGNRKLITPAVSAIIQDDNERILFIRRRDNDEWAMPAGMMELDETVYDCLRREVEEETGLDVRSATLISVKSGPSVSFTNMYGNEHQGLVFVFRVDKWDGDLIQETDETIDAAFFSGDEAHKVNEFNRENLSDLRDFAGQVFLK